MPSHFAARMSFSGPLHSDTLRMIVNCTEPGDRTAHQTYSLPLQVGASL
jgi:hypothetical protein